MTRKANFFIVGAPKCGTTAMTDYLSQHPEIFMPEYKDAFTFGSDLSFIHNISHPPDKYRVPVDMFQSWFDGVTTEKRYGDATVWHLYSQRAASEIKEFNPDAKIIIQLRNPVDMMYSLHSHQLFDLNEELEDFEEALAAEEDRKMGRRIPATAYNPSGLCYRSVARFTEQVRRYFDVFGRDQVHVIIFDDLTKDTAMVYRKTLEFLEVDPAYQAKLQIVNTMKQVLSKRFMHFIVNPPRWIAPLGNRLSRVAWLRKIVYDLLVRFNTIEKRRPPMDPVLRKQLQEEFRSEVKSLSDLLGRDLTHWSND